MAEVVPSTNASKVDIPPTTTTPSTPRPPRKLRPNYNLIHRQTLPLKASPLPAFLPHHPLSLLRLAYALLSSYLALNPTSHPTIHHGYYDPSTNSVHITDPESIRALWEQGFFGKGNLSRSEPEWEKLRLERQAAREAAEKGGNGIRGDTAAEVTRKRREERRRDKLERARVEAEVLEMQLRAEGKLGGDAGAAMEKEKNVIGDDETEQPNAEIKINGDRGDSEKEAQEEKEKEKEALLAESLNSADSGIPLPQQETHPHTSTSSADTVLPPTHPTTSQSHAQQNQEHLQLTPSEAFFLTYALGILKVHPLPTPTPTTTTNTPSIGMLPEPYTTPALLSLFSAHTTFPPSPNSPTNPARASSQNLRKFLTTYTIYHHYRSLGWVIRSGIKFGVDYLLYYRGPAFSHAEFAVLILPDYSGWSGEEKRLFIGERGEREREEVERGRDWWWLHAANRVQSQVRKTLVLAYVEVPVPPRSKPRPNLNGNQGDGEEEEEVDVGRALQGYRVREFVLKRWSPNRDRG